MQASTTRLFTWKQQGAISTTTTVALTDIDGDHGNTYIRLMRQWLQKHAAGGEYTEYSPGDDSTKADEWCILSCNKLSDDGVRTTKALAKYCASSISYNHRVGAFVSNILP